MKTVLAVVGTLAILAVILVVGGGYYVYRKAAGAMAEAGQQQVEKFIAQKHPPQPVADSLRRLTNAVHGDMSATWERAREALGELPTTQRPTLPGGNR